jgi:hypothetical protein
MARPPPPRKPALASALVLGWREWVALPALGLHALRAKVDSGARSSALHVHGEESFERDGAEWVRFRVDDGGRATIPKHVEAPVADRRVVTDSGGHRRTRVFISTRLLLPDGRGWRIELNLAERRNMVFPMLIGRTALPRGTLVAPRRSFVLGPMPPPDAAMQDNGPPLFEGPPAP